jgi:hypothetical protein
MDSFRFEMASGFSSLKSQIARVEIDLGSQISRVERDLGYVKKDVENLERKVDLFIGLILLVNITSILDTPLLWKLVVKNVGKPKLTNQGNTKGANLR